MKISRIPRFLSVFLILTLFVFALTACQSEKSAWTLDEALQMVGTEQAAELNGRIPLSDDFSMYEAEYSDEYTADSGKIVILWREGAEKSFSRSSTPFPDDYRGEEQGKPKVYLCADLMDRIPESRRAATAEEAKTIIMAESYYYYAGSVESSDEVSEPSEPGMNAGGSGSTDDMNTAEFRPLFNGGNAVMLYSCETKGGTFMAWADYPYAEMRDNPEADDLWWEMLLLKEMAEAADIPDESERYDAEWECLDGLYYYSALPDSAIEALYEMIEADNSEAIRQTCMDTFWKNAQQLSRLDPGFEEEYGAAISEKSFEELESIVNARAFSFIAMSNEEILIRKAYLGTPDAAELQSMLDESLSFLDDIEWNMTDARRILLYGY